MAYAEKYYLPFVNVQGYECSIHFFFEGWGGGTTELTGGAKPFVLGEFNTDEDYFKPLRPQIATLEIIAKNGVVGLDNFLADNDTDIYVRFDFGDWEGYWYGYLSQDDLQETWIDTIHILTLRATEGIGVLKELPLTDTAGFSLQGVYTPFTLIQLATDSTIHTFTDATIICNLFHDSMTDGFDETGLDQCYIDARTFESQPTVFDDCYTVLEKINKAWNLTLFQWNGKWFLYRLPEIFKTPTLPLYGFVNSDPDRVPIADRFDITIGDDVYPIVPEMIKYVLKPSKETKVVYNWDNFEEIACNETFTRGDLISETVDQQKYEVDCWTFQKGVTDGAIGNPTTTTGTFERRVDYVDGRIDDNYIVIEYDTDDVDKWVRSSNINCGINDRLTISFKHKWGVNISGNVTCAYVLLYADDSTYYTLNADGSWSVSNSSFTTGVVDIEDTFSSEGEDWMDIEVNADPVPKSGYFVILLYRKDDVSGASGDTKYFKDLKIDIVPQIQDSQFREITGDYDKYTIERNINKNFSDEIFMDDADSKNHKGALLEQDGYTLTGDQWYRRDYDTERLTFKRQNALAHWFINRSYKTKLDCNFFGLVWTKDGVDYPIGLMNTINFPEDAPTKTFAISNLKEIDFMSCQWSASLIEVYDTDVTEDNPTETDVHSFNYIYGNKS